MNVPPQAHPGIASAARRTVPVLVGVSFAVLTLFISPLAAQTTADPARQRGDAARQLESNKGTLRQTEQREQAIKADLQQLSAEQARVNEQLIEMGRHTQSSEARLSQIEARLGELDAQEKLIRGSLAARHDKLAKLFSAMQRMGRNPPPVIITQREDALQMVRSAMLLARAFPELKAQADELSSRLQDLVRVMTEARSEGDRLKSETARLTEARTRLAALVESKRRSQGERQRELDEVRRSATEIARNVSDLSDLITRLDKAVAQHTALGAYEQELREREAREAAVAKAPQHKPPAPNVTAQAPSAPQSLPGATMRPTDAPAATSLRPTSPETAVAPATPRLAPGSPATDPGTADAPIQTAMSGARPQPPRVALEPQGAQAANPGRMKPAMPFHLAKGQLPLPAQGKRVLAFGEKNQFGRTSRGMVIETRTGATVTSPSDGWVVYAGEFRSYGQVLIINAGGGYHILLANLARTEVEVGRFVLAGEPVGAMSSNVAGKTQDNAPVLYVEFRNKEGQSIDPAPWWADSSQRVQG